MLMADFYRAAGIIINIRYYTDKLLLAIFAYAAFIGDRSDVQNRLSVLKLRIWLFHLLKSASQIV